MVAGFLVVALVAGAAAGGVTAALIDDGDPATGATPTTEQDITTVVLDLPEDLPEDTTEVAAVATRVLPSVVRVVVSEENPDPEAEQPFIGIGTGSGVGFTAEGHVLTNSHVVEDADLIEIELVDGRIYQAELVGRDPLTDVAVIKVEPGLVQPIPLGDRDGVQIGDMAIAIGNPLGLAGGPSVSVGIVSAFERQLDIDRPNGEQRNLQGLIQTDAAISGGSSGGALVDATGSLIGITTAKSVGDTTEGVGFAVPVDLVENIAVDLIAEGAIDHPFLGILGTTRYEEQPDGGEAPVGAEVVTIFDGTQDGAPVEESSLGEAGALEGDVIVAFDGIEVTNMNQLASILRRYRAGETVPITVVRAGKERILDVVLGERPSDV